MQIKLCPKKVVAQGPTYDILDPNCWGPFQFPRAYLLENGKICCSLYNAQETEFGKFYRFEPLTLCSIDKKAIATDMLSDEELAWINNYHQLVYNRLSPLVSKDEEIWLKEATNPIKR